MFVQNIMIHTVTLIPGDGIGPEIADAMVRCVDATGVHIHWDRQDAGIDVIATDGNPLPERVLNSLRKNKIGIKGPITTPVGTGYRSLNVFLRKEFDTYQNIRPCKTMTGVRTRYTNVDLVVFRENTDDLYTGVEFQQGQPSTKELLAVLQKLNKDASLIRDDSGISIKPISAYKTERIVKAAFEYALSHQRKKVSVVHKANIMKYTDGLFLEIARKVATRYPTITFEDVIVDNLCMQLVQKPELYNILVLPNLYGDIVSDLCAGLVGGLGVAPGANIGDTYAVFEAVHGSAPKYKNLNKANPTALILSACMMLDYLGEKTAAARLQNAVENVIAEGKDVTYDLKPTRDDPTCVGTKEMANAIIRKLK